MDRIEGSPSPGGAEFAAAAIHSPIPISPPPPPPPPLMDDDGEDRISGLPDELLHAILARLGSPRTAVRTGVLSRRWRHLWAPQPELILGFRLHDPLRLPLAAFLEFADAALALCAAPTLERLYILPPCGGSGVPAGRIEPWLRFASERVVGTFLLSVPRPPDAAGGGDEAAEAVLDLPACEGVTQFDLNFDGDWRLRPPPAGLFRALTVLNILSCRIEAGELAALVNTQCPCLMDLSLTSVALVKASDLSIRSDSLRSLSFSVRKTIRLEIVALRLEKLSVSGTIPQARIAAPTLAELDWSHPIYSPYRHHFDDVGRCLRVLEIGLNASLMQRFNEVDELKLAMFIPEGIAAYRSFLNETNNLPKCKILTVSSGWDYHGLVPGMLHLLRSCSSTRKVFLLDYSDYAMRQPCVPACPCLLEESSRIDDISLNSLEEVEIISYASYHGALEFLEQLSRCNAAILKKIILKHNTISALPPTKEVCDKILGMWQPNIEVESYLFLDGDWMRLY